MTTPKKLGIWMDDSTAHLIEFIPEAVVEKTIELDFSINEILSNKQNVEKDIHVAYCQALAAVIKNYQEVVLFGPAKTKGILSNLLLDDNNYAETKIDYHHTGNMTNQELHDYVRNYFSYR